MKKSILILLSCIMIFNLTGCNKSNEKEVTKKETTEDMEKVEDTIIILPEEEQNEVMKEHYKLLTERADKDTIVDFINNNIESLDEDKREIMITSLEEFLSSTNSTVEETYTILEKYKEYLSKEMKSYLNILEKEIKNSFTDGEQLKIDIDEILDRALLAETHLLEFPKGETHHRIFEIYKAYINGIIVGTGNQYIFSQEGSSIIKDEYVDKYKGFIQTNNDTKTSNILNEYIKTLEANGRDLNSSNVVDFYDDLENITKGQF